MGSSGFLTTSIKHPNEFSIITGKTNLVKEIESVSQSLRLLLTTAKGELFGDPDFGSNLYSYLYEYSGEVLYQLIRDDIVEVATSQDSRIQVSPEDITFIEDGSTLHINVAYSIKYTDLSSEVSILVSRRNEEEF